MSADALTLAARGKKAEQEILARDQPEAGAMSFTRQQAPLGLGHAVWCARDIVGDDAWHEGKYGEAAELFDQITTGEYVDFLTLPAYARID